MIRILHYIGGLNSGGAETFIMNVYKNIDKSKIQFDFIVDHPKQNFYNEDIKEMGGIIHFIEPVYKIGYFKFKKKLNRIVNDGSYKIIHVHVRSTASLIFKALKGNSVFKIMHSHNNSNGNGITAVFKRLLQLPLKKQADFKFACSDSAGRFVFSKKGVKTNYLVIPNGIDSKKYYFNQDNRKFIRDKYNLSNDTVVVGHIGRFVKQKNHKFIVELANSIPNVYFMIIGSGPLKDKIQKKVVNNNVIFVDSTNDVNKYYSAFDLFILPSLWEGLGIVLLEAQYNGLECITSNAIQDEAIITNKVKRLSLNHKQWIDEILSKGVRASFEIQINDSRYDILSVSKFLEKFYFDNYERK